MGNNCLMSADELAARYGKLDAFEIEKKIGKGQFSEVYRARCKEDNKVVALKKVQTLQAIENLGGERREV
ncbi:Serine/threonine-protein kinase Nek6 [Toxocara canis]|uniref:Serine/threonine-protein kinase Nek6 n=1 Tax=Toxocara canis TaxID=6265 RepID=A0A0B2W175_TOXCA|nr:Serine/threonine-protein kinase Nek6 [Toxocara canis]